MKYILKTSLFIVSVLFSFIIVIHTASEITKANFDQRVNQDSLMDVSYITLGEHRIAYRTYGDEALPVLVFVHGFLGSSYDYRFLSEALSDKYYIIAVDLLGFGASDKPGDLNYEAKMHADTLHLLIQDFSLTDYTLVGHSMGGRVVLSYAHFYPENLQNLILIAPAGPSRQTESGTVLPRAFYRYIFNNYYLQRLGFRSVHHQNTFKTSEYFDPMFYFSSKIPIETLQAFSKATDSFDLSEVLGLITVPTLIIHGENDTWVPLSVGENYDELLPQSQLVVLEDTGHIPFIESLDATLEALRNFLE